MSSPRIIIVKTAVVAVIWALYFIVRSVFYSVMTNEHALEQLSNSSSSYTDLALWQQLWGWSWIIPLVICIIIFWKEIKTTFYNLGGFVL